MLRQKADVDKKLSNADITKTDAVKSKEIMEKKLEEVLTQISSMKESTAVAESEQSKQIHNLQASNISLTTKLNDIENELRQKEEKISTLENQVLDRDSELSKMKIATTDGIQQRKDEPRHLLLLFAC